MYVYITVVVKLDSCIFRATISFTWLWYWCVWTRCCQRLRSLSHTSHTRKVCCTLITKLLYINNCHKHY